MTHLKCYIDGSSLGNPGKSGIGVYIPKQLELSLYIGHGTNNHAEMTALIIALGELEKLNPESSTIYTDSELVFDLMNDIKRPRGANIAILLTQAKRHANNLANLEIKWIDRKENKIADKLAREASKHKHHRRRRLTD